MLEADESDNSVFRNSDLEICSFDDWEYGIDHISSSEVRFIGVDWDKAQAGTNIAVLQYNIEHRTLKMIYREEVPRSEFTYVNAVNKIVEIYEAFRPELVIADQGSGEVQWEYLMMEGMKRRNGLAERLIKKAFNSKLETLDLVTQEVEKKLIKPFLVGLLQQKVQQHLLKIPKNDKILLDQFLQYEVIARTASTVKFSSSNEHIIDCCLFAMYGVWYLYENFLENTELTAPKNVTNQDFKSPWDEQFLMQQLEDERSSTPNLNVYRSGFTERNIYRDNTDFNFYRDNMDF
jgi:replicative DNA helicase